MKLRSIFSILFLFYFFVCDAKPSHLASSDVQGVMSQLFEYHIDKKEMSATILERSLKIYLKQFDPTFSYLLQEEALPYLHPTEKALKQALDDYREGRFPLFFSLNQIIQDSVIRARAWRYNWEQNPQKLVTEALKNQSTYRDPNQKPTTTLTELKENHYRRFIDFISLHLKEFKSENVVGKEAKIVLLCEKQMAAMENEYLGIDDHDHSLSAEEKEHYIILRTLKALAQSLDAHTAYYSPEEAYAMKVQLEKGMCGIGVVLREGIDGVIIQEMLTGGPAEKCGKINKGDVIVEVDGTKVGGFSFHNVMEMMKGKEGTTTALGIMRSGNGVRPEFFHVELTRAKIILADKRVDISSEPYGDGIIGKITLHSFYEGDDGVSSEKDLKNAIEQLRTEGPLYGLILDMRDNSGGFLTQSVKVSGLFISNGVVVISKYSDGSIKYYRAVDGTRYYDGPLVILISRGSASATEIVAQALKDYGVAVIVGDEQTYGKGTIQHQTVTSDGSNSFFKVTIGRYYSVSGKSAQIDGVKSDILVPSDLNFEELGENYLEYPLPTDCVSSAYQDTLEDVDPLTRKWFQKYYSPSLQAKEHRWDGLIPILKDNSARRINQNRNFQNFLKNIKEKIQPIESLSFGLNDLQMDEAVNIVKDMIFLSQSTN